MDKQNDKQNNKKTPIFLHRKCVECDGRGYFTTFLCCGIIYCDDCDTEGTIPYIAIKDE